MSERVGEGPLCSPLRAAWTKVFDAYRALTPLVDHIRQLLKEPKS